MVGNKTESCLEGRLALEKDPFCHSTHSTFTKGVLSTEQGTLPIIVKNLKTESDDPDFNAEFARDCFQRELEALTHIAASGGIEGVVTYYGRTDQGLVLEFINNRQSFDFFYRDSPVSYRLALALSLAKIVYALSQAGVVHRDIKPSNVLLIDRKPILIDFGLSWVSGSRDPHHYTMGTDFYSPLEMLDEYDDYFDEYKIDVFSLSVTLLELLERENPFLKTAENVLDEGDDISQSIFVSPGEKICDAVKFQEDANPYLSALRKFSPPRRDHPLLQLLYRGITINHRRRPDAQTYFQELIPEIEKTLRAEDFLSR